MRNNINVGSLSSSPSERVSGLDGLRAISICLVLLGHGRSLLPEKTLSSFLGKCFSNHRLGVSIFFVISGFIITWLLLREKSRTGRVSLAQFYLRRFFRIFPAFYLFLGCLATLALLGRVAIPTREWVGVLLFVWNYLPHATCWWVGHFWSLAVEEQFYLVWPVCLAFATLARAKRIALVVIAASPLIRPATYYLIPSLRDRVAFLTHAEIDLMAFGCLAALAARPLQGLPTWPKLPASSAAAAVGTAFFLSTYLTEVGRGAYGFTFRNTVEGLSIAVLLIWLIQNPRSVVGRVMNAAWVRYIGRISYSLYLWQQLFLVENNPFGFGIAGSLTATFVMAVLSYHAVELPCLRFGARWRTNVAKPLEIESSRL